RDVLARYPADVVRFYLIATHYRSPLDFDDGKLEEARKALGRLKTTLVLADEFKMDYEPYSGELEGGALELMEAVIDNRNQFIEAMDDDFNTAKAMAYLFEISHRLNAYLAVADRRDSMAQAAVVQVVAMFKELGDVMGIFMEANRDEGDALEKVLGIFSDLRQEARKNKDFTLADHIRDFLKESGVSVEDGETGSRFRYEQNPGLESLMEKLLELRSGFKKDKQFAQADFIRNSLQDAGIILEDTREGARWKFAEA
ncbi:MAG: DALR domain-containing protein, partial [Syntrophomonas sp.]